MIDVHAVHGEGECGETTADLVQYPHPNGEAPHQAKYCKVTFSPRHE